MSAASKGSSVNSSNVNKRSCSLTRLLWIFVTLRNNAREREPERPLLAAALDVKPHIVLLSSRKGGRDWWGNISRSRRAAPPRSSGPSPSAKRVKDVWKFGSVRLCERRKQMCRSKTNPEWKPWDHFPLVTKSATKRRDFWSQYGGWDHPPTELLTGNICAGVFGSPRQLLRWSK